MARPVAILCNGPSLADHDLGKITCPTIGLNRSWELKDSDCHIMTDAEQWEWYEQITNQSASSIRRLHTGENGPKGAIKLHILESEMPAWSWRPFDSGVYECGTVTWIALQLAVYWDHRPIYMVGLDLKPRGGRGKFWGGEFYPNAEARQRELMGYAAALFGKSRQIVNLNPDSRCWAFPRQPFSKVFP